MADRVWTIGSILDWTKQYFGSKGVEQPRLDAEVLLSHVLRKERIYLYVHFDEPLEREELAAFRELVKRRAMREPVAALIGRKEFMGLDFAVNEHTLIPRPDTETLVQTAIDRLRGAKDAVFADIGTGTGAIALSILHYLPETRAVATDVSPEALRVAKRNATMLELAERVEFVQGDLLSPLAGRKFAAILSNPPYIPDAEIANLAPEVRHEPKLALAGGLDGLDFYRRFVAESAPFLEDGGFLALEVGIHQAGQVAELARKSADWGKCEILRDLAGIERVILLEKA